MRDNSSPGAETLIDYLSGATFVKKFANSLDVAGSDMRSAPTDSVHFLMGSLAVAASKNKRRTLVLQFSWLVDDYRVQFHEFLSVYTAFICIVSQLVTAMVF